MSEFETNGETGLEARLLANRPAPQPQLRDQVLARVVGELAADRGRGWWTFAGGLAAALLIGLNLSLSVGHCSATAVCDPVTAAELEIASRQIEQVVPDLPGAEIRRELLLARIGGRLTLLPKVSPLAPSRDQPAVSD